MSGFPPFPDKLDTIFLARVEAKLALPLPAPIEPKFVQADGIITFNLFDKNDFELECQLVKLGIDASWCFDRYFFQPILFVYEFRVSARREGLNQLAIDAACTLDHRIALGLEMHGVANPVYCLLQTGSRPELFIAYTEAVHEHRNKCPPRKIVRCSQKVRRTCLEWDLSEMKNFMQVYLQLVHIANKCICDFKTLLVHTQERHDLILRSM